MTAKDMKLFEQNKPIGLDNEKLSNVFVIAVATLAVIIASISAAFTYFDQVEDDPRAVVEWRTGTEEIVIGD